MPAPQTPAEHREAAAALEAQAAQLREKAALAESAARLHRAMADMDEGLTTLSNPDTVDTMNASALSNVRRSSAALDVAHRRHPFIAALKARNITVKQAADAIGRPRSTVQAWYKRRKDTAWREIPWECAEKVRELYGVPHDAWASVGPKP